MSNVIPKAGQFWNDEDEYNKPVRTVFVMMVDGGFVRYSIDTLVYSIPYNKFVDAFTFIPQNDLEWLAVKVDLESFSSFVKYVSKGLGVPGFLKPGLEHLVIDGLFEGEEHYTRDQLQGMRYELGLDEAEQTKNNLIEDVVNRLDEAIELTSPQPSNVKIVINDDLKPLKNTIKFTTTDGAELEKQDDGTFICVKGGVSQGDLISQKEDKPIFTQAMADAGEFPPVGSDVELFYDDEAQGVATAMYIGEYSIFLNHSHGGEQIASTERYSFKPIQTEEQKLIAVMRDMNFSVDEVDDLLANDKFTITLNK